jgi:phosphoribosyl 1,2-cyclic phosphodiesterase
VKLISLGSGSSGNAFLLESDETTVLLDCGVGAREIQKALSRRSRLSTVIISHEHGDHVRSLSSVLRKHSSEVVATRGTLDAIGRPESSREVRPGGRIQIDSLSISFIGVSHDAAEPCGFLVENSDVKVAILTDL